jgi:nitroreductase
VSSHTVPARLLAAAVERALLAPSVHNTQPWRWRVADGVVELHADETRHLVATDPDRRDLVLSCGAALHHLRVALAAAGLAARVHRLPDPEDRRHLATVHVEHGASEPGLALLDRAVAARRTDRRPFGPDPVPPRVLDALVRAGAAGGAAVHPVTAPAARRRLDEVLAAAAERQRSVPGYAAELTIWSHRAAACHDGIPAGARPSRGGSTAAGLRVLPGGRLPGGAARGSADGSALLVVTTAGDGVLDRLRAGEASSAVLLAATLRGLATTPLSQAHETPAVRARLARDVLRTPDQPQLVVRVGHPAPDAPALDPTPRRPLESVLLAR